MRHYEQLILTLDKFIRKYYFNQLLRGLLLVVTGLVAIGIILSFGEYFLYFPSWLKISLLAIIILTLFYTIAFWVIRPLFAMQRIGKTISHKQAADVIGNFFPEVKDKLLNVLQLQEQRHEGESIELALAGIEQKSSQISVIPILGAVNLKENKRYLYWLIPSLILALAIALFWPQIYRDSAFRLSQPTKNFYPPAPFKFMLKNKKLEVPLNGNYSIKLKVSGKKLPAEVHIVLGGKELLMQTEEREQFSYTLQNVNKNTSFYFMAAGFRSEDFQLLILERPQLEKLTLQLSYPAYTGIKNEIKEGFSDISLPEGTKLKWEIATRNTTQVHVGFIGKETPSTVGGKGKNNWQYQMTALKDSTLHFYLSSKKLPYFDTLSYRLKIIQDKAPQVSAQQDKDTISGRQILLTGIAADDYGLSKLLFHYTISDPDNKVAREKTIPIEATHNARTMNYHYYFDINTFQLLPGQTLQYYVEAWDNDAIHGAKKAISELYTYRQENQHQLDKSVQENNLAINKQISNSTNEAENINQDVEKFRQQMLQSKDMTWEQQNQLKSLTERQENIQKQIDALKKRFEIQQRQSQEKEYSENIRKKQKELEKQLDKIKNNDLAEQMKKLQEMLQQKNKNNTFQELKKWQEQNKLFQMDMERIQALMKQLALQMKMEDMAKKAGELAEKQANLSEKTNAEKESNSSLSQSQKELQHQLDDMMKKDFAALEKANQETENPQDLSSPQKEAQEAQQQMGASQESLQQNQTKKAGSQQKNASQNLEKMAASLSKMAGGMDMRMIDINIKAVRQLLTNLMRYSFAQEDLLKSEKSTITHMATYEQYLQTQHNLKQNTEMIKDSLFTLSKRIFELAPAINKETTELTSYLEKALFQLENRRIREARIAQQYAMTNANNLALMLDETLRNLMQSQMQSKGQKGGSGMPSAGKPGAQGKGSTPGQMMKDIITGQQQMGKGMSQMQGQGEKGKSSGDGQQQGENGNSKENGGSGEQQAKKLARLAQQQAALRNMMQDLSSMLNSQGNGQNAQLIKEIQKAMNQNEVDLVNRRLNSKLIHRQKEILTRLLKAQDAIRNQEQDNKRIAESAKNTPPPMPPELKEALRKRKTFLESYQTVPASLKPFYKKMSEDYQKQISSK